MRDFGQHKAFQILMHLKIMPPGTHKGCQRQNYKMLKPKNEKGEYQSKAKYQKRQLNASQKLLTLVVVSTSTTTITATTLTITMARAIEMQKS